MDIAYKPTKIQIYNVKFQFSALYLLTIMGVIIGFSSYFLNGIDALNFTENSSLNYFWPQNIYVFDKTLRACFTIDQIYLFMFLNALVSMCSLIALIIIFVREWIGKSGIGSIPTLNKFFIIMLLLVIFVTFNKFDPSYSRYDFSCQVSMGRNIFVSLLMVHMFYLCCAFLVSNMIYRSRIQTNGET